MFEQFTSREGLLTLLYSLPGILIAISFHEFAHAYSAYKLGDDTARRMGRMTISPVAHFDLIGFLLLLIAGFGWAKPVPVNPGRLKYGRYGDLIVSLAGVTTNLLLAFLFTLIYFILLFTGVLNDVIADIISPAIYINLALFIFNLIPISPLDGYHVLRDLTVGPWAGGPVFDFLDRYGMYILLGLVITGATGKIITYPVIFIYNTFSTIAISLFSLIF